VIRNLAVLGGAIVLAQLLDLDEKLSSASKLLVLIAARSLGVEAREQGEDLVLGAVVLPWTPDCSGVNALLVLLGVCGWLHARDGLSLAFLMRLALCVPAAMLANLLRIGTIAVYRGVFHPHWESLELHFLIGFVWLAPFVVLLARSAARAAGTPWTAVAYLVSVLSLLAPLVFDAGGVVVAGCTAVWLAASRLGREPASCSPWIVGLWLAAAVLIAWSRMESLWLPWLLACPVIAPERTVALPARLALLVGTVPLVAMQPVAAVVAGAAVAWVVWRRLPGGLGRVEPGPFNMAPAVLGACGVLSRRTGLLAVAALGPFLLPSFVGAPPAPLAPPSGLMSVSLAPTVHRIRLIGQSDDVAAFWYGAGVDGRHHSVVSCMRYQGKILESVPDVRHVLADEEHWVREIFIQGGDLSTTYAGYLAATFAPFSEPGVHVIFQARRSAMSARYFARTTGQLATRLRALHAPS
jgi:exosortase/archaeosortase family protein